MKCYPYSGYCRVIIGNTACCIIIASSFIHMWCSRHHVGLMRPLWSLHPWILFRSALLSISFVLPVAEQRWWISYEFQPFWSGCVYFESITWPLCPLCISDRFIASPSAQSLHIHPGVTRRAQPNAVLEKVFTSITKVLFLSVCFLLLRHIRTKYIKCDVLALPAFIYSSFVHTESKFPPSGRPFQAAGLGGAKGPALVQTPQEPR